MLLPFPVLLETQIPTSKKVVLLGLFGLGTFITIIQIIRILTIKSLSNYLDSSMLIMWSMVENNLGVIVASIPPLSPLVRAWKEKSANASNSAGLSGRNRNGTGYAAYAMGSMAGGRAKKGHIELESGHDGDSARNGSTAKILGAVRERGGVFGMGSSAKDSDNSSEEYIMEGMRHGEIKAVTEIKVTLDDVDGKSVRDQSQTVCAVGGPAAAAGGTNPFRDQSFSQSHAR